MSGTPWRRLRRRLTLTQVEIAAVLGVHPITVSRWERGLLAPSSAQHALLGALSKGRDQDRTLGEKLREVLHSVGPVAALTAGLVAAEPADMLALMLQRRIAELTDEALAALNSATRYELGRRWARANAARNASTPEADDSSPRGTRDASRRSSATDPPK